MFSSKKDSLTNINLGRKNERANSELRSSFLVHGTS